MAEKKDVTILVNSCDLYEDAWTPFFKLFSIHWADCPYEIVLNTEEKVYDCDFLNVKTICTGKNVPWSKRVKMALKQIDTEYVCFFLEDFFLQEAVDTEMFEKTLSFMKENKNVGVIHFQPFYNRWTLKGDYGEYYTAISRNSTMRTYTLTALWRKKFLYGILRDKENPWEYEKYSPIRAARKRPLALCFKKDIPLVFRYGVSLKNEYGISDRKWLRKNKELFDKYNIEVNYENLGWYTPPEKKEKRVKRTKKELVKLIFTNPVELASIVYTKGSRALMDFFKTIIHSF